MKIDLLKILEDNKKTTKLQEEVNFRKELNRLITSIIDEKEEFKTDNLELIKKLELTYKKNKKSDNNYYYVGMFERKYYQYIIKLTKANITKINDYVNKEGK